LKQLECIIKPFKLDDVRAALCELGITGLTAFEVKGFGRQKGRTARYRGSEMDIGFIPKIYLKMVVKDGDVEKTIKVIKEAARTGEIGDGKIFISSIDDAIRIRTGERGEAAL